MEDASSLLEPLKSYPRYKEEVKKEAEKYFENLEGAAHADVKKNQELCADYYTKKKTFEDLNQKANNAKGWRTVLIILSVFFMIIGFFLVACSFIQEEVLLFTLIIGIVMLVLSFIALAIGFTVLTSSAKSGKKKADKAKVEQDKAYEEVTRTAQDVNALFDWGMASDIINKVVPVLKFDKKLDDKKYELLRQHYGMEGNDDPDLSIVGVQSGSILGNPFILLRQYVHSTINKSYEGHLTIHWVTYERDSEGHSEMVNHSEVLTAYSSHPAPSYHFETYLVYGNEAAPDLNFTRYPNSTSQLDEKKLKKQIRRDEKKMEKKAADDLMDKDPKSNFTPMANSEFESLFHAWDRDNEQQFRLLFTPLGQKNMTDLLKSREPFGDDFAFLKREKLNYVESDHSQEFPYIKNPSDFTGFDLKEMKERFTAYVVDCFTHLYFDLAPLLSIPLYQMTKTRDYIYNRDSSVSNVSDYEQEAMANTFDWDELSTPNTITPSILKTEFLGKKGNTDDVLITSHSFSGIDQVDYVSTYGGDGYWHDVPVHWTEYIPESLKTRMEVTNFDSTRPDFNRLCENQGFLNFVKKFTLDNDVSYRSKLMAYLVRSNISEEDSSSFDDITKDYKIKR